jgi:uncharacterized protein YjbJ (UPF0337 family)
VPHLDRGLAGALASPGGLRFKVLEKQPPAPLEQTLHGALRIFSSGDPMKSGANDKVQGAFHEAKGKIKEVVGKVTNQPDLELAGACEKKAGKLQITKGKIKTALGK